MKLLILAGAALLATPAYAQMSGSTGTSSPNSNGGAGTPTATRNQANDSMSSPNNSSDMSSSSSSNSMSMSSDMGSYPMCSRTVTDHCMERSNARGERLHSTPPAN